MLGTTIPSPGGIQVFYVIVAILLFVVLPITIGLWMKFNTKHDPPPDLPYEEIDPDRFR